MNKALLLTTAAVLALVLAPGSTFSAEQLDNVDDASVTPLLDGNSARWAAPAAGVDEVFTVGDNVNVGDSGAVVGATTDNGVGTLRFLGTSTATGTFQSGRPLPVSCRRRGDGHRGYA